MVAGNGKAGDLALQGSISSVTAAGEGNPYTLVSLIPSLKTVTPGGDSYSISSCTNIQPACEKSFIQCKALSHPKNQMLPVRATWLHPALLQTYRHADIEETG